MLLIIHNLPFNVKYAEIKALIQSKCGLSDFVLDNLQSEGTTKRVTVGLADEGDAAFLVRKINGLYLNGQQLYVEDVRQTRPSEQPYRPKPQEYTKYQRDRDGPRNQPIQDYQDSSNGFQNNSNLGYNPGGGYQDNTKLGYQEPLNQMPMMMNYNAGMGGMYYPPQPLMAVSQPTSYLGFADQSQPMGGMSQFSKPQQEHSYGYGGQARENTAGSWDDSRPDNSAHRMHGGGGGGKGPESRWEPPQPVPPPAALRRSPSPRPRQSWNSGARAGPSMASIANYYDPHAAVAAEPQYTPQRNFRSDFAPAPTNAPQKIFGDHVVGRQERDFPRRQQWNEPKPFQRKGRDDGPRGGGFAGNNGPKPFERRNRDDGPRPNRNWRDEPKGPPKRFADRRQNEGPPQKKFAPPPSKKFAPPPRASKYEGDMTKKWRENVPRAEGAPKFDKEAPITMQKMLNKDDTWRGQAAAHIAKEMANKLQIDISGAVMLRLKRSIRSRINLLLGSEISSDRTDIEARYRAKFPTSGDADFLEAVTESADEEMAAARAKRDLENSLTEDSDAAKPAVKKPVAQKSVKPQSKPKSAQNKLTVSAKQPDGKLPSFPNADKKAAKRMKAEERTVKDEIIKELPPTLQKTLDEEVDVLSDLFMSECMDTQEEDEKVVCTEIADVVSDEFRKLVRLHMTKRLLNMNANLTVRAISRGKVIHRDLLEAFVKDYGAVALKKSEKGGKLYLIYVNSYDNYDKLCALGDVIIGGFNVVFKPLHVLGPPPTAKEVREQMLLRNNKFLQSQIDQSKENLLKPGYSITPTVDSVAVQEDQIADVKEEAPEVIDLCDDNTSAEVENSETEVENAETEVENAIKAVENAITEAENAETGEVVVAGESDADQEGEVYDIEGEEDEEHQVNGDVQECDVEDVIDCDPEEADGENVEEDGNVDEDDLEDY